MSDLIPCPGCGAEFPPSDGATHAYIGASAGCWGAYPELLGREYSDPAYMRMHQHTVDAYTVQHPGQPERRSIQSVAVHLISLHAMFDLDYSYMEVAPLRQRTTQSGITFTWLEPPDDMGDLTVKDVLQATTASEHADLVLRWAQQMWTVWEPHHDQIRSWTATILGTH